MTPAKELAAAAAKLDALAAEATDGPWFQMIEIDGVYHGRMTVIRPEHGKRVVSVGQTRPHYAEEAEANVAYIAAMNPLVGKALAAWLRHEAEGAAHGLGVLNPTLDLARAINGGQP